MKKWQIAAPSCLQRPSREVWLSFQVLRETNSIETFNFVQSPVATLQSVVLLCSAQTSTLLTHFPEVTACRNFFFNRLFLSRQYFS